MLKISFSVIDFSKNWPLVFRDKLNVLVLLYLVQKWNGRKEQIIPCLDYCLGDGSIQNYRIWPNRSTVHECKGLGAHLKNFSY